MALALAGLDLGQTVVVKDRAAVAVEAMEGNDETIRRAFRIAGPGTVVVKVAKPKQDMRFDVPVVGEATLDVLQESGAAVLAVEAKRTLVLDREAVVAKLGARAPKVSTARTRPAAKSTRPAKPRVTKAKPSKRGGKMR